ncbi:MAG: histidine phosphatase family protein [Lachnospiraceae bacterium]
MKIILVRHAEPDYSIDSLTNKGWKEAEILSERIQKLDVKKFYVSPLGRARATAETALKGTGIVPEVLDWAREFEGRCVDPRDGHLRHCWDLYPADWTKYPEMYDKDNWVNAPIYRNTNIAEEYEKVKKGLDALLLEYGYRRDGNIFRIEKSTEDTIVIFCHMAVSLLMIGYLTGIAAPLLWHGFFAAPSTFFEIETEERVDDVAYFRVKSLGDYSHLYSAGEPCSESGFKKYQ